MKFNIGCGWRNFGKDWIHIDGGDYDHLDYKDITKLEFDDNSVELIYASHVLEYFDIDEAKNLLQEWRRVLKSGGELRIAVPDFETMSSLYNSNKIKLEDILGPLYGRMNMGNTMIYHKTTYDFESLYNILSGCLYDDIKRYDWREYKIHRLNDDHSQAYLNLKDDKKNGTLISLNVTCKKLDN